MSVATITEAAPTFADAIAAAKQREAVQKAAARQANDQAAAKRQAERRLNAARIFGKKYQNAVVWRLVNRGASSAELEQANSYVDAMLWSADKELPNIKAELRKELNTMFRRGLQLATEDHRPVPAGTFNGQRKLAEEAAAQPVRPERLVIRQGDPRWRVDGETVFVTSTPKVELPPAITPAGKKKVGKKG